MYLNGFNPYEDSVNILKENASSVFEKHEIEAILEDVNSPIQMKYSKKIYDAVLQKGHIDFDDIPESKGDINLYSGTKNMKDVLYTIKNMNEFQKTSIIDYVNIIEESIKNIENTREIYKKGFDKKCEYVMIEYCTLVYTCVEATTSILYEFVDYIKKPGETYQIKLKNTKYRANLFFIQQLEKYNNVNKNMLSEYRKFLLSLIDSGSENLIGTSTMIGLATVTFAPVVIIPIIRGLIYSFVDIRRCLSEMLLQQAYFLEMNKNILEAKESLTVDKKKKVLERQEKVKKQLIILSEKLRVEHVKAREKGKREIEAENRDITVKNIRRELDDSPLQLL